MHISREELIARLQEIGTFTFKNGKKGVVEKIVIMRQIGPRVYYRIGQSRLYSKQGASFLKELIDDSI